jgi:hypothetical protein
MIRRTKGIFSLYIHPRASTETLPFGPLLDSSLRWNGDVRLLNIYKTLDKGAIVEHMYVLFENMVQNN